MHSPHAHPSPGDGAAGVAASAAHARGEAEGDPRYCPTRLLASFALLMAGHGRCVNTDMMLGDREYAMWQLACAKGMGDAELDAIALRLLAYFDDPQHSATPMLGTA